MARKTCIITILEVIFDGIFFSEGRAHVFFLIFCVPIRHLFIDHDYLKVKTDTIFVKIKS
jgi:hypothetical protein